MTPEDPEAVSRALLDAYRRLVRNGVASNISFAALARAAGMNEADLRKAYPGEEELLLAVHKYMCAQLTQHVIDSISGYPAGVRRIQAAVSAFLDACLKNRFLRSLQISLQSASDTARQVWQEHRDGYEKLLAMSFKSMGLSGAEPLARSLLQRIEEVAHSEMKAGRVLPDMRDTLAREISSMVTH
ncbi:MAG: TetR/AcrR family transcriptional regulator [Stenotrophobium sp.]